MLRVVSWIPLVLFSNLALAFSPSVKIRGISNEFHADDRRFERDSPSVTFEFETLIDLANGDFHWSTESLLNQGRKGVYDEVRINASFVDGVFLGRETFGSTNKEGQFVETGHVNDYRSTVPEGFLGSLTGLSTGLCLFPDLLDIGGGYGTIGEFLSKIPDEMPFGFKLESVNAQDDGIDYTIANSTHRFVFGLRTVAESSNPVLTELVQFSQIHRPERMRSYRWSFSDFNRIEVDGIGRYVPHKVRLEIEHLTNEKLVVHTLSVLDFEVLR